MGKDIYNSIYSNIFKNQKTMKQLIYFSAVWCGPCATLGPIMDQISTENGAHVTKVDVDANQDLTKKYHIKAIPTVLILDKGQEVSRFTGVKSKNDILALL